MSLIMDGLLIAATLFAGTYCWILSRRVQALKSLDSGLGGSIVTLTRQIELARSTLEEARANTNETRQDLAQLVGKAESAAGQLRLLIATLPAQAEKRRAEAEAPRSKAAEPEPALVAEKPKPRPLQVVPTPAPAEPDEDEESARRAAAEVPKPRYLPPLPSPLRGARSEKPRAEKSHDGARRSEEDELIEALSALAGGR